MEPCLRRVVHIIRRGTGPVHTHSPRVGPVAYAESTVIASANRLFSGVGFVKPWLHRAESFYEEQRNLIMGSLGPLEIALICTVLLLMFGAKRIPEIARGIGKGLREFKDATRDIKTELHSSVDDRPRVRRPQSPVYGSQTRHQSEVSATPPPASPPRSEESDWRNATAAPPPASPPDPAPTTSPGASPPTS